MTFCSKEQVSVQIRRFGGPQGPQGPKGDAGSVTAVNGIEREGSGNVTMGEVHPRNLLHNRDFTRAVNQRGQTSYSGDGYAIDRWRLINAYSSMTVNDGYVTFSGSGGYCYPQQLVQADTSMLGKAYTAAVCLYDGTIHVFGNGVLSTLTPSANTLIGTCPDIGNGVQLGLYIRTDGLLMIQMRIPDGQSLSLRWAVLYEGGYTADTLPPYVPKGYAAELMECQRYCYAISIENAALSFHGYFHSTTEVRLTIPIGTRMRVNPTIVFGDISQIRIYGDGTTAVPSEATRCVVSGSAVTVTLSGFDNGVIGPAVAKINTTFIISADL